MLRVNSHTCTFKALLNTTTPMQSTKFRRVDRNSTGLYRTQRGTKHIGRQTQWQTPTYTFVAEQIGFHNCNRHGIAVQLSTSKLAQCRWTLQHQTVQAKPPEETKKFTIFPLIMIPSILACRQPKGTQREVQHHHQNKPGTCNCRCRRRARPQPQWPREHEWTDRKRDGCATTGMSTNWSINCSSVVGHTARVPRHVQVASFTLSRPAVLHHPNTGLTHCRKSQLQTHSEKRPNS